MKIEPSAARSLQAVVENDLKIIAELNRKVVVLTQGPIDERDLATVAYALHNIYNALENSFDQISRTFENHVVDTARWHRELCAKMFLEIEQIRPAVFSSDVRPLLDEMLRFRHLFRHSYDFRIDPERLQALCNQWEGGRGEAIKQLKQFAGLLAGVAL